MYYNLQLFFNPLFLLKIVFLFLIFLFIVFMLIALNQVRSLSKTINQSQTPILIVFGILILLAAASLFLTSLAIL
jgi:hypothetical protein